MVRTLPFHGSNTGSNPVKNTNFHAISHKANITQLVRVLGCGPKSHRFETCYSPVLSIVKS